MKNIALVLCLLLCFPVAGKEKDEVTFKRWSLKSKLACAGALFASVLAMALLQSRPKTHHAPKTSDSSHYASTKLDSPLDFSPKMTCYPLRQSNYLQDSLSKKLHHSSLPGYYHSKYSAHESVFLDLFFHTLCKQNKETLSTLYNPCESHNGFWNKGLLKKCNDALQENFDSFDKEKRGDNRIYSLFTSTIPLSFKNWSVEVFNLYSVDGSARSISSHYSFDMMTNEFIPPASIPLASYPTDAECISISLKNKLQPGNVCDIKFSCLETQFLRNVVSQKLYLDNAFRDTEDNITSLVSCPALTCLQYCLSKKGQKSDSRVELPAELLQIVKEYDKREFRMFTLQLPESFFKLQRSDSIMRLDNREDFDRFLESYRRDIDLDDSCRIRAVGPDGKEITVD